MPGAFERGEQVSFYGEVYYFNRTAFDGVEWPWEYPAENITVRIYGTDDQKEDYALTDDAGYFYSTISFEAGQYVTITIEGERNPIFIPYDESGRIWLGRFYIEVN